MSRALFSREFRQLWLPTIAITAIGILASVFLTVIGLDYFGGTKPVGHVIPVSDESEAPIAKVLPTDPATSADPVQVAPSPAVPRKPAPKPQPKPAPNTSISVAISADGCTITAAGEPGMTLYVHAHNDSKGGESTYTIPASGTLTELAGGIAGMTVEAKILAIDASTVLAEAEGLISPPKCWDW